VAKKRTVRVIKTKKRCCKSRPRCKRCPVVCKRLAGDGLAERVDGRHYVLSLDLRKKQYKAARG
jgi:polyferredoxin